MGVRCKDGVLLAVEKLLISKMLVAGSNRRAIDETVFWSGVSCETAKSSALVLTFRGTLPSEARATQVPYFIFLRFSSCMPFSTSAL